MEDYFDVRFPSMESLREKTRQRIPGFAYDYLTGGCMSDVNLKRNTSDIREVQLRPYYLREYADADLGVSLFGKSYSSPFGIAPVGLQGLMWPKACEILAKAAKAANLPFVLSTVTTASIETVAEITEGDFWFQLYHPREDSLRDKLLKRAESVGCETLVILADTPVFGYRPREIRNGLSIPPRMSLRNVGQMVSHPVWSFSQLAAGVPTFKSLEEYLPKGLSLKHLGEFMNRTFSGRLSEDRIKKIRVQWKGNLVVKGLVEPEDVEKAIAAGVDGVIVSNHGGRQLDSGRSSIESLAMLADEFASRTTLMMDGGIRSGSDIASCLASGAAFAFAGRAPMYGVCALGKRGGDHVLTLLNRQLRQVMEQVACKRVKDLRDHLST